MNWKTIALGGGAVLCAAISGLATAVNQSYSRNAHDKAESFRTEEEKEELSAANEVIRLAEAVRNREGKELTEKMRDWDIKNSYKETVREINRTAAEAIDAFKESINYDDRKEEIEQAAEDAIESFKDSIDFDDKIESLNDDISMANELFNKRCRLYNIADTDDEAISDAVRDLKKIEKDKRDNAIRAAKDDIQELKDKVDKEKSEINRKMNSELRELDKELIQTKNSVEKKRVEQLSVIDKKRDKYKSEVMDAMNRSRTDAEVHALQNDLTCRSRVKEQDQIDAQRAVDFYRNAPNYEKWAAYMREKHVPKWVVAFVGSLPLIPACWGIWAYARFLWMTVKTI